MRDAERTLKEAEALFQEANWNQTIRRGQETVELTLKAALHFLGIDYPKRHDVGSTFASAARKRIPQATAEELRKVEKGSDWLDARRTLAFYRDQEYTEADALEALEHARFAVDRIRAWCFSTEQ